jgi:hypothetical protein
MEVPRCLQEFSIAIVVVVVLIALAIGLSFMRRRRHLRERFGPEYERTVEAGDSRVAPERDLRAREKRHDDLDIKPLPSSARQRYSQDCSSVQEHFVDRPEQAVGEADELVTRLMRERGYPTEVEASDGSIGKVDKHSQDVGAAYIVVDTGVWIFGKHVLLPAGTVSSIDVAERKIYVSRTKDEIKDSPEFDKDKHLGDSVYRDDVGGYYGTPDLTHTPHGAVDGTFLPARW